MKWHPDKNPGDKQVGGSLGNVSRCLAGSLLPGHCCDSGCSCHVSARSNHGSSPAPHLIRQQHPRSSRRSARRTTRCLTLRSGKYLTHMARRDCRACPLPARRGPQDRAACPAASLAASLLAASQGWAFDSSPPSPGSPRIRPDASSRSSWAETWAACSAGVDWAEELAADPPSKVFSQSQGSALIQRVRAACGSFLGPHEVHFEVYRCMAGVTNFFNGC